MTKCPVFAICAGVSLVQPVPAAVIDLFSAPQDPVSVVLPNPGSPPASSSSSMSDPGILGLERDIIVNVNVAGGFQSGISASVSNGSLLYSTTGSFGASGSAQIQWDGVDGSAALNPVGLGGIDLTSGSQTAFRLVVQSTIAGANLGLTVYSDAIRASSITFQTGMVLASQDFFLRYSDFTPVLGTGADFSNVGAVTFTRFYGAADPVRFDGLETVTMVPEPSVVSFGALVAALGLVRRRRRCE